MLNKTILGYMDDATYDIDPPKPLKVEDVRVVIADPDPKSADFAVKFDTQKLDWSLLPMEALEEVVQVLEFGAKKYDGWNWARGGGFKWTRLLNSTFRHLFAFARGENQDPESGLSHISHAMCNLVFLSYYIRNRSSYANDDRHVR